MASNINQFTSPKHQHLETSEGEISDDGLRIVTDSPNKKIKSRNRDEIVVENELDTVLNEKAAKANLSTINVKNILKHVVTNEHVLAYVQHSDNPQENSQAVLPFEPKFTRAKAKQLLTNQPLPWVPPAEVKALIDDELAEDSSGDEYIPAYESEDDRCVQNELEASSPPKDNCGINWTVDGVFKIPSTKKKKPEVEENIALRTRSKLSLSSTPLEAIEEAFIPPDLTPNMYDVDCDDEVWRDFLNKFTSPLDDVTKAGEDEELDPEYNVLADEEIDKVDKEELRVDRGVKVPRKELHALMAELFEYADAFSNEQYNGIKVDVNSEPQFTILQPVISANTPTEMQVQNTTAIEEGPEKTPDSEFTVMMNDNQKLLLEQQMRQHVQILTQNFILTYQHPEFSCMAPKFKENLLNLKYLSSDKEDSFFNPINLHGALELMSTWIDRFSTNSDEIKSMQQYVVKVFCELKQSKTAGTEYVPTFPKLILDTISKSNVFLYPSLLPRIPFKSESVFPAKQFYTPAEDELIVLGLEQFYPFLAEDSHHISSRKEVNLKHLTHYLVKYMMPMKKHFRLYTYISQCRNASFSNPIKYYYKTKKAPALFHYIIPLKEFGILAPCKRDKKVLPYQWQQYLYPEVETVISNCSNNLPAGIFISNSFTQIVKEVINTRPPIKPLLPKSSIPYTNNVTVPFRTKKPRLKSVDKRNHKKPKKCLYRVSKNNRTNKLENYFRTSNSSSSDKLLSDIKEIKTLKFNSTIFHRLKETMLPSMPMLSTPSKNLEIPKSPDTCAENVVINLENTSSDMQKDNEDDINALMIASSTIKNKRRPSGTERKRAKIRREYSATLAMLTPEEPNTLQEKALSYAQAYFDKAQETLDSHEYHTFMEILNDFDEKTNTVSELYQKIEGVLSPKYPKLLDEFITFLTPVQARDVGKLITHVTLSNMSLFLRKLEMYFKDQPAQLRKIYRSLTDLTNCVGITMEQVKGTILPLLKGNSLLMDWFLQIFPCERPSVALLSGPYEQVDIGRDCDITSNDELYELINVPDCEDPYGGLKCVCNCHDSDDQSYKARMKHCIPCGTKFLQGRVYVQTGKGLRLANITFNDSSTINHHVRLNSGNKPKKRSEISPSKQLISPVKDGQDEVRISNDSEDDLECIKKRAQKLTKSPRKRKIKSRTECSAQLQETVQLILTEHRQENVENQDDRVGFVAEAAGDLVSNETKPLQEEVNEWDCNTSIESIELRLTPEPPDSESEFCEESSQDNVNSASDESAEEVESLTNSPAVGSENSNSNTFDEISWTRDEDKIILETFQQESNKEQAFILISETLENRTVLQIKQRFQLLMNLLQEMAATNRN